MSEPHLRRLGGLPHFHDLGWDEAATKLAAPRAAAVPAERLEPARAIIRSVFDSGRERDLAVMTSFLGSLTVTSKPLGDPPFDVVQVFVGETTKPGTVRIEHVPLVGIADSITRPVSEAVPLFWRFMIEKYGISPT